MRFQVFEKTDVGRVRKRNEDSLGKSQNKKLDGYIFCVADGMGGYGLGDVASRIVVEGICADFSATTEMDKPVREWVIFLFNRAEKRLQRYRQKNDIDRFGTTLAIIIFMQDITICANVGDTRIYSLDDRSLIQESHDHTLVNQLVQAGRITPEEAHAHPNRHMLTLALTGERKSLEPYVSIWPFDPDRTYVIASDGLYNMVEETFLLKALTRNSLDEGAESLFKAAMENGATDNITFQVIKPLKE
ncbi:MAG: hypothetical protein CR997_14325 [Acidobacteria bacterium]|nr:MAG: hypothetical protein CR997_14325 [Acidobacteriota bacterium]